MKEKKRVKKLDIAFLVLEVLWAAASLAAPAMGPLVLLEEAFTALLTLTAGVWLLTLLVFVIRSQRRGSAKHIAVISLFTLLFLGLGGLNAKDIALDLAEGTRTISLQDCGVQRGTGTKGIFSLNYYLAGEDGSGEAYRFKISGGAYDDLSGEDSLTVEYYGHNRRIVRIVSY